MEELCFCHLGGYAVKDATARKQIAEKSEESKNYTDDQYRKCLEAMNQQAANTETAVNAIAAKNAELSARMDAFTALPAGSTAGDAELADARIGFDGVTHNNAGTAIRNQAQYLENKIPVENIGGNLLLTVSPEEGAYYSADSGGKLENTTYMAYPFVKVEPSTMYAIGVNSGTHIAFYDRYKNYLSGTATDANRITTPEKCEYLCFSCNVNLRSTTILQKMQARAVFAEGKKIAREMLPDLCVDDIKGLHSVLTKVVGENLLDYSCGVRNYYIPYNLNYYAVVSGYTAMIIPAKPLTKYSGINCSDAVHIAYLNSAFENIDGEAQNHAFTITTPESCAFIAISVKSSQEGVAAFCEGETAAYSAPGSGGIYGVKTRRILEVGSNKEYTTITAAVNAAMDGDTVLVYPGTYTESVKCIYKTITIEGVNKRTCILTYPNGDYSNPPLGIASGVLKNLTIKATYQAQIDGAVAKAYAMHTDNGALTNNALYVENVDFVNADKQTVGIGLRGNGYLEFVNCSFICEAADNAFYCHDNPGAAAINQHLIVNGCTFVNNGAKETIRMQSQEETGSTVFVTWQRNIVKNKVDSDNLITMVHANAVLSGDGWLGATGWTLNPESAMNTLSELNA